MLDLTLEHIGEFHLFHPLGLGYLPDLPFEGVRIYGNSFSPRLEVKAPSGKVAKTLDRLVLTIAKDLAFEDRLEEIDALSVGATFKRGGFLVDPDLKELASHALHGAVNQAHRFRIHKRLQRYCRTAEGLTQGQQQQLQRALGSLEQGEPFVPDSHSDFLVRSKDAFGRLSWLKVAPRRFSHVEAHYLQARVKHPLLQAIGPQLLDCFDLPSLGSTDSASSAILTLDAHLNAELVDPSILERYASLRAETLAALATDNRFQAEHSLVNQSGAYHPLAIDLFNLALEHSLTREGLEDPFYDDLPLQSLPPTERYRKRLAESARIDLGGVSLADLTRYNLRSLVDLYDGCVRVLPQDPTILADTDRQLQNVFTTDWLRVQGDFTLVTPTRPGQVLGSVLSTLGQYEHIDIGSSLAMIRAYQFCRRYLADHLGLDLNGDTSLETETLIRETYLHGFTTAFRRAAKPRNLIAGSEKLAALQALAVPAKQALSGELSAMISGTYVDL